MVGYSDDVHTTIAPMGMPYKARFYCNSQGSQLHKTVNYFSSLVVCVVSSRLGKLAAWRVDPPEYQHESSMFYDSHM